MNNQIMVVLDQVLQILIILLKIVDIRIMPTLRMRNLTV